MRFRLDKRDIAFIVFAGAAVVALLYGTGLPPFASRVRNIDQVQLPTPPASSVIVAENARAGTDSWKIPPRKAASTEIQAYASATSALPGQKLTFYVSTQKDGTSYSIEVYRLGWYGGSGGRLMSAIEGQVGHSQGYYDSSAGSLVGCSSCRVDTSTGLIEANWRPSYTLTIPSGWTTGLYLAKFTDSDAMQTYVPFNVRGNSNARYVVVSPFTTYAAYNNWGGYSLYTAPGNAPSTSDEAEGLGRGVKVSFDRPYASGDGSGDLLSFQAAAIHWLERQGYDLSYITNVDLHENPAQLLQHRAYLSVGHDEYWTKEMRDGVESARNSGVGLGFLGANVSYWQVRFEPDSAGTPDRTVVCYKVLTRHNDLASDPFYGKDNARVTTQWRDPLVGRPENALVGIMYSSYAHQKSYPWRVSPQATSPFLQGTGLQRGQQYGCGLVGYEWDSISTNGLTPEGLQVLGESRAVDVDNHVDISNTTYYIASSGAMVFATGSIGWTSALDNYQFEANPSCVGRSPATLGIQKLMANVMDALAIHHAFAQSTPTPTG